MNIEHASKPAVNAWPVCRGERSEVPAGFEPGERRLLLATPGISHGVICRLESAGVNSIRQLNDIGVDALVDRICNGLGTLAWRNRKRALSRALAQMTSRPRQ